MKPIAQRHKTSCVNRFARCGIGFSRARLSLSYAKAALRNLFLFLLAASTLLALPASAQQAAHPATDFYLGYRAAWSGATTIDPLLSYIAKDSRRSFEAMPQEERNAMFDVMKQTGTIRNLRVVRETN